MATWPGSLPTRLQFEGFQGAFRSTAIETQMDAGPSKRRQRFTAAPEPYQGMLRITGAQIATLKTFFESTLFGGSLSFDGLAHPLTGATVNHRFRRPSDQPPSYRKIAGDLWEVSLTLEVMP